MNDVDQLPTAAELELAKSVVIMIIISIIHH